MRFRNILIVAGVTLLHAFGSPAIAQSVAPTEQYPEAPRAAPGSGEEFSNVAQGLGALAGIMAACNGDRSGLDKLDRWLALTPPNLKAAAAMLVKLGTLKGQNELSIFSRNHWIRIECESSAAKSAPETFNGIMRSFGIQ